MQWVGCRNDREAAGQLHGVVDPVPIHDLANRFRKVCAELGTKVSWHHKGIHQQPTTTERTITAALREVRTDERRMAESRMADSTPLGLRLR